MPLGRKNGLLIVWKQQRCIGGNSPKNLQRLRHLVDCWSTSRPRLSYIKTLHKTASSSVKTRKDPKERRNNTAVPGWAGLLTRHFLKSVFSNFPSLLLLIPVNYSKARLVLCLHPVKLFVNFGHSAAPNPNNYVTALVLYGTQGPVWGLNRWECKWLPLSPTFNAKRRWRENSYVF